MPSSRLKEFLLEQPCFQNYRMLRRTLDEQKITSDLLKSGSLDAGQIFYTNDKEVYVWFVKAF